MVSKQSCSHQCWKTLRRIFLIHCIVFVIPISYKTGLHKLSTRNEHNFDTVCILQTMSVIFKILCHFRAISVDFSTIDKLLMRYSVFFRYWKKNGSIMVQEKRTVQYFH